MQTISANRTRKSSPVRVEAELTEIGGKARRRKKNLGHPDCAAYVLGG